MKNKPHFGNDRQENQMSPLIRTASVAILATLGLPLAALAAEPPRAQPGDKKDAPGAAHASWPTPVPGFVPVQPGEHPRLLFRKTDLPAIKARAQTPEGRKIVERLKATLGGGEAMPTLYNKSKRAYDPQPSMPEGTFTISHIAGFGMLYQLTGDKKYAELGRQCFLKGKEGIRDRDNRYSQTHVDGQLRLGPSLAMLALGYDLCYDGWDEAFRVEVAQFIQNYSMESRSAKDGPTPPVLSFKSLVYSPRHGPVSNHHGAIVGGAGFAVLGLLGDPGTDTALLKDMDTKCQEALVKGVPRGFGPYAFYAEGQGPSHVGVNSGLQPYVQALRVAAGQDYISGSSMVQWFTLRWVMELLTDAQGQALYPIRHELMGKSYGTELLMKGNGGMTHGGWFSQGFGTIPESFKPALLWTYQNCAAKEDKNQFDTLNYPHRAIMALVNWPLGMKAENPARVMPKAICDTLHGYYVIRNRWQDSDDVVITMFGKTGNYRQQKAWPKRPTKVFGVGQQVYLGAINGQHDHMETAPDGSTSLRWPGKATSLFAVDFSRRGGVEAVIVHNLGMTEDSNSYRTLQRSVAIGGSKLNCLTLSTTDRHPAITAGKIGDKPAAIIGGLAVTIEDGKLVFHDAPGTPAAMVEARTFKKLFVPPTVDEKDVKLPTDPSYALDFDSRVERDGKLYARNMAPGRRVNGKGDAVLRNVTFVPGVLGDAIQVGKGVAFVPAEATETDLGGEKGFTISYWIYTDDPIGASNFQLNRNGQFYSGYTKGMFRGAFDSQCDVDTEVVPEKWHHIVWIGNPAQKRVSLWYDGNYRGSAPSSGKLNPGAGTLGLSMMIADEDVPVPGAVWQGRLDEVRFYRRPLATGEAVALYREGANAIAKREEGGNRQPSAVAVCEPAFGLPPLAVKFDASGSSDPEEGRLTYAWDFGDGATGTGVTTTHTYAKLGKYAAKLTVTDDQGSAVTIEKTIRVQNEAPKVEVRAGWDAAAAKGEAPYGPEDIKLDASASADPEGKSLKFTWTLAGQTYQGAVVRAKLPAAGAHPVTLVADDGTGRTTTWRSVVNRPDANGRSLAETAVGTYTPGLHYRYFHQGSRQMDLSLEKHVVFPIEWNVFKHFGTAHAPLPWNSRLRPVHYWIDWAGYLEAPADGEYTFHFNVKGGAYLWLGSRLIGNWYQGFMSKRENEFKDFTVKLQKGAHRFRLVFMANKYGNQNVDLTWSGPGFANAFIPPTAFTRSLTVAEQRAAGIANPQLGSDVWDWFPESNPPLEGTTPPPATKGKLELTINGPGADRFVTASVKLPADFVEPVEIICHPGDGSRVFAREFSRLYPAGAEYTVTVEARDAAGRSATAFRKIAVPAVPAFESIGMVFVRSAVFLRPTTVAGVFPQGFWNPVGKTVQGEKIRDNQGREVALTVTPVDQLPWHAVYTGRTSPMEDQLLSDTGWFNTREIALEAIPYDRYDLVVIAPGARTETGLLEMTVAVGDQTRKVVTTRAPSDFDGRYIEETEANPAGNYIVFRGLTGSKQTIALSSTKNSKRPAICAIQIIRAK